MATLKDEVAYSKINHSRRRNEIDLRKPPTDILLLYSSLTLCTCNTCTCACTVKDVSIGSKMRHLYSSKTSPCILSAYRTLTFRSAGLLSSFLITNLALHVLYVISFFRENLRMHTRALGLGSQISTCVWCSI